MESKKLLIIGLILISVSFVMFLWGMHMFTYAGNYTEFMGVTGFWSFLLCIPVFIIALVLIAIAFRKKDKI
ncbi:hypothetical protein QWY86_17235 [Pedobacter aquatilis]|uniref:hypothetical protein n=1 Tax=Pedobacter aquatilis TaxID=351343 RepID=UPI0025B2CC35|nr:hypothetical protein [Pedobacter aquatilis]MDN3588431.1 hypothetical protein [Pedobacter aquatilis]